MAKKLTKKEVGQAITMEVRYFLETLGFDDEDDQGRYITFFSKDYPDPEDTITFYKGTLGCNSDPYALVGPGYSNFEYTKGLKEVETALDAHIEKCNEHYLQLLTNKI